jgi:lipid-A-disaccharide synthase
MVVPELLQDDLNAERVAAETLKIMNDKKLYDSIKDKLRLTREKLGSSGASKKIAHLIKDILSDEKTA